jgi:hypothetical protein
MNIGSSPISLGAKRKNSAVDESESYSQNSNLRKTSRRSYAGFLKGDAVNSVGQQALQNTPQRLYFQPSHAASQHTPYLIQPPSQAHSLAETPPQSPYFMKVMKFASSRRLFP